MDETISFDPLDQVQSLCAEFEFSWSNGEEPSLSDCLAEYQGDDPDRLLRKLLWLDMHYSRRMGEAPTLSFYEPHLPQHSELIRKELEDSSFCSDASTRDMPPPTVSSATTDFLPEPGKKIDRFLILEPLGQGGFGQVWRCFDPILELEVAVKIPRPDRIRSQEEKEAFLLDARRAGALRGHPNIVDVHDARRDGETCFIVSSLIKGPSLSEVIAEKRLPWRDAVRLIAKIAFALDSAHQKGIVHRDVKPSNILIDENQEPFLTDFGLAATFEEQLQEEAGTRGTFPYMPPEVVDGKSHLAGPTSDIFSLGVVLYELLTGVRPFQGISREQLFERIRDHNPKSLSLLNPDVPSAVEAICFKCLRKNPEDRYVRAKEIGEQLLQVLQPRRPRTAVWIAAGATLVIGAILLVLMQQFGRETAPTQKSQKPPEVTHFDPKQVSTAPGSKVSLLDWKPDDRYFPRTIPIGWKRGKPLTLNCPHRGMLILGKTLRPGYKVRIEFWPTSSRGWFGFFFGLGTGYNNENQSCVRYQVLRILPTQKGKGIIGWHVNHDYNLAHPGSMGFNRPTNSERVEIPRRCSLDFEVTRDGLRNVVWCDELKLTSLGTSTLTRQTVQTYPDVLQGETGVMLSDTSLIIDRFQVTFLQEN